MTTSHCLSETFNETLNGDMSHGTGVYDYSSHINITLYGSKTVITDHLTITVLPVLYMHDISYGLSESLPGATSSAVKESVRSCFTPAWHASEKPFAIPFSLSLHKMHLRGGHMSNGQGN